MVFGPDVEVTRDVPVSGSDREPTLDIYRPGTLFLTAPAVLVIHGGGFCVGDKADEREAAIALALAEQGYVCACLNYTLSAEEDPWSAWPRNLHDCRDAVRFLRLNADLYGVDTESIGAIGASAGGYLALMLAHSRPGDGLDAAPEGTEMPAGVQAVVSMYGPVLFDGADSPALAPPAALDTEVLSPLTHLAAAGPPTLLLHGTEDDVVPLAQSCRFAAAAREAGVECSLILVDGAPHSFDLEPAQLDLRPMVLNFFNKHLRAG